MAGESISFCRCTPLKYGVSGDMYVGGSCRILTVTVKNIEGVDNHDEGPRTQLSSNRWPTCDNGGFRIYHILCEYHS